PACLHAEGDDAQGHHPEGCPAGQSTHDATRRRARKDGDYEEDDEADAVKQVELLCGHAPSCAAERPAQAQPPGVGMACNDDVRASIDGQLTGAAAVAWSASLDDV